MPPLIIDYALHWTLISAETWWLAKEIPGSHSEPVSFSHLWGAKNPFIELMGEILELFKDKTYMTVGLVEVLMSLVNQYNTQDMNMKHWWKWTKSQISNICF